MKYYLVAWDLPVTNERRTFYRKLNKIIKAFTGETARTLDEAAELGVFEWAQQSVIITSDKKLADEIYLLAAKYAKRVLIGEIENLEKVG